MAVSCASRRYYISFVKQYRIFNNVGVNYSTASLKSLLLKEKVVSMQNKISDVMKWYENLTGLDEIRMAQNKVIEVQERFATAQEKRREVTLELNNLKNKIKDIQEELVSTPRGDERLIKSIFVFTGKTFIINLRIALNINILTKF